MPESCPSSFLRRIDFSSINPHPRKIASFPWERRQERHPYPRLFIRRCNSKICRRLDEHRPCRRKTLDSAYFPALKMLFIARDSLDSQLDLESFVEISQPSHQVVSLQYVYSVIQYLYRDTALRPILEHRGRVPFINILTSNARSPTTVYSRRAGRKKLNGARCELVRKRAMLLDRREDTRRDRENHSRANAFSRETPLDFQRRGALVSRGGAIIGE